ncbi:WXG100 family type VII secretion target [Nocardia stercoris]|uniref:ESAT-6-like protein n=1 Tax=Nocardia stercoris TaxID=2483361 RepID=A0A3M2L5M4_9NOCA|nr:WXG100 family type VII secretion target [Nocardia stercoris]RMI31833.1 hypothetical protein EBN03_16795 [Nocardia stercoris]
MATDPGVVFSKFHEVNELADAIVKKAGALEADLQEFYKGVQQYCEQADGQMNDSFQQKLGNWNERMTDLKTTLHSAGQTVGAGNDDLQNTDQNLSKLFH